MTDRKMEMIQKDKQGEWQRDKEKRKKIFKDREKKSITKREKGRKKKECHFCSYQLTSCLIRFIVCGVGWSPEGPLAVTSPLDVDPGGSISFRYLINSSIFS